MGSFRQPKKGAGLYTFYTVEGEESRIGGGEGVGVFGGLRGVVLEFVVGKVWFGRTGLFFCVEVRGRQIEGDRERAL